MTDITVDLVDEVWHELVTGAPAEVNGRLDEFRRAQPVLAGYVRAVEEGVFVGDERGQLTLFALWAYEVCRRAGRARGEIGEDIIESMLVENERLLTAVESAPASDVMSTATTWTSSYPHLSLLGAILNQAMQGEMENPRRVDDFLGLLTLHAKTMVDCLALA
ncbi:MAG: hypothetical protein ACKV19_14130 [Verrucomicrobiales bacterium]